jgi:hypothetical protein
MQGIAWMVKPIVGPIARPKPAAARKAVHKRGPRLIRSPLNLIELLLDFRTFV